MCSFVYVFASCICQFFPLLRLSEPYQRPLYTPWWCLLIWASSCCSSSRHACVWQKVVIERPFLGWIFELLPVASLFGITCCLCLWTLMRASACCLVRLLSIAIHKPTKTIRTNTRPTSMAPDYRSCIHFASQYYKRIDFRRIRCFCTKIAISPTHRKPAWLVWSLGTTVCWDYCVDVSKPEDCFGYVSNTLTVILTGNQRQFLRPCYGRLAMPWRSANDVQAVRFVPLSQLLALKIKLFNISISTDFSFLFFFLSPWLLVISIKSNLQYY